MNREGEADPPGPYRGHITVVETWRVADVATLPVEWFNDVTSIRLIRRRGEVRVPYTLVHEFTAEGTLEKYALELARYPNLRQVNLEVPAGTPPPDPQRFRVVYKYPEEQVLAVPSLE